MDPATALAVGSLAIGAFSSIQQGQAAKSQANYQATVARQQADRAQQQAAIDAEDYTRKQSAAMATRRAALGASGVEAGSGSPLLVSEDFAGEAELQALRIRNGGDVAATRFQQEANLQQMKGRSAATKGFLEAGSDLLRGGSQLFAPAKPPTTTTPGVR